MLKHLAGVVRREGGRGEGGVGGILQALSFPRNFIQNNQNTAKNEDETTPCLSDRC